MLKNAVAWICLFWYAFIVVVSTIGYLQLWRYYRQRPNLSHYDEDELDERQAESKSPHITVIRPIKGLDVHLYDCLAATFRQSYPRESLSIFFCVESRSDPAVPVIQKLLEDFPDHGASMLVADEDAGAARLGPNPKIRNMSRAYREGAGDVVWILDCNVWVGRGVARHMVETLGVGKARNKFVHLLPLVVDVTDEVQSLPHAQNGAVSASHANGGVRASDEGAKESTRGPMWGGRFEELFMSSSHAKFYTAINTVLIAPCIVGKSSMFRRSHLNSLTANHGIDFFSRNICEDHLIGDLLWKRNVAEEKDTLHPDGSTISGGKKLGKHAMVFGDLAIQPMANVSIPDYFARRTRWLRVRKFTVPAATLVEPGTESFLCSAYGAYALTALPFFHDDNNNLGIHNAWPAFISLWLLSVSVWAAVDWTLYLMLHSMASVEQDEHTPPFARRIPTRPLHGSTGTSSSKRIAARRPFTSWLLAWLGREALALPIWLWAIYGGVSVVWRGKKFWVGLDMKVHEILPTPPESSEASRSGGKVRRD